VYIGHQEAPAAVDTPTLFTDMQEVLQRMQGETKCLHVPTSPCIHKLT